MVLLSQASHRHLSRPRVALLCAVATLTLANLGQAQSDSPVAGEPSTTGPSAEGSAEGGTSNEASAAETNSDGSAEGDAESSASGGGLFESASSGGGGLFESAGSTEESPTAAAAPALELHGYVRSDTFIGKVQGKNQSEIKAAYAELSLQAQARGNELGDAYADVRFRYGQVDTTRKLFVDLREAYVNAYLGPIDLRLGQQVIAWGRADGFNPTSNLTAVDFTVRSPQEDDKRMSNLAMRSTLNFQPMRLELVWQPLYNAVVFPPLELPELVVFGPDTYPAPKLVNSTAAARLHLELSDIEMSASYLYGFAPMPGLAFYDVEVGEEARVELTRVAYRHQVIGFDFSTALGDALAIRGEAAYRLPENYQQYVNVPRPDVQYVLGLERGFGSVSVIAQYMGRYVLDWQREPGPEDALNASALRVLSNIDPEDRQDISDSINLELAKRNQGVFQQLAQVQHSASARIEWLTLADTLSFSVLGMMNFTTEEWLAFPKVSYKFSDTLSGAVGGEIYMGPEGTLLDLVENSLSAGYAELKLAY